MKSHHILIFLALFSSVWVFFISGKNTEDIEKAPHIQKKQFNNLEYATGRGSEDYLRLVNIHKDHLFMSGSIMTFSSSKKRNTETVYDTKSDNSITKFVSRKVSLNNSKYVPRDLVDIKGEKITLTKWKLQLRSEANATLQSMATEFNDIFQKELVIVSSYRSYKYQENLKKKWCPDTLCADAGHSEHQLGLAVDLFAATDSGAFLSKADFRLYYERLAQNAHRYGRHNSYQKWVEIDTYQVEPRHRRYLGRDLATVLFEQKMTLAEWIKKRNKKQ